MIFLIFSAFIMYGNLSLGGAANQLSMNDVYVSVNMTLISCLISALMFPSGLCKENVQIILGRRWISKGTAIMGHYLPGPDKFNPSCLGGRTHKMLYLKQVQKYS